MNALAGSRRRFSRTNRRTCFLTIEGTEHNGERGAPGMTINEPSVSRELIRRAQGRGLLSPTSARSLSKSPISSQIEAALDDSYGIESAGELLLVTMMPDDSASMAAEGVNQSVIAGHNDLLDLFRDSPARNRILLQTRFLNTNLLNPFQPLDICNRLDAGNYPCIHGTPLFEQTMVTLGSVIAKTEELLQDGAAKVRTATLIMTDGYSTEQNAEGLRLEVESIISDMRRIGDHIVAGMGFSAGNGDKFRPIFAGMGI